jgi:hypothetical protein
MKNFMFIMASLSGLLFCSCKNENPEKTQTTQAEKNCTEVSLNPTGDTSSVTVHASNIKFVVRYFNNKPQNILVQDASSADSSTSHFVNDNRGIAINLDPQTRQINFVACKYIKAGRGADIFIDSAGMLEAFTAWEQYGNNGKRYDIKQSSEGKIKEYLFKDGEKVDSVLYQRK